MFRSLKNTPLLKTTLSLALVAAIFGRASADEPFAIPLNKWAPDKSTAESDESFSVEIPVGESDPFAVHFTFAARTPSQPPQVRSIFDAHSLASFVPGEGKPVVVQLTIKGSNPGRHVRLRLTDASSEVFDTKPLTVEGDYSTLEFPLDTFIEANWGGDENGRIDWPLKMLRIETVDWAGPSPAKPETLSIRSVTAASEP